MNEILFGLSLAKKVNIAFITKLIIFFQISTAPAIPWSLYGENVRTFLGTQVLPQ